MTINNDKAKELQKDFPILQTKAYNQPLIYLDNAATTQKPEVVINAISNYYKQTNANVHRSIHYLSAEATKEYESARKVVAEFLNAKSNEIIFTKGTTEAMNLLSQTIKPLLQGTEIILTEMEHHSNLVPWQQFAKKNNLTLKYIKLTDDFELDYDHAKELITNETAIIAFTAMSNTLGTVVDIKKITALAKQHNSISIVDAAQAAAKMPIDVKYLDCDFLACSSHKMCGPTGVGILYGKKELLDKLTPYQYGGDMIDTVTYEDATWNEVPTKFEAGTPNIAGVVATKEAINYLKNIGLQNIQAWEEELINYAKEKLQNINDIENYTPKVSGGVISFNLKNTHSHDVASLLDQDGIAVRSGHHCTMPLMKRLGISGTVRISVYFYNTFEDIDLFIESLKKIQETLGE